MLCEQTQTHPVIISPSQAVGKITKIPLNWPKKKKDQFKRRKQYKGSISLADKTRSKTSGNE